MIATIMYILVMLFIALVCPDVFGIMLGGAVIMTVVAIVGTFMSKK